MIFIPLLIAVVFLVALFLGFLIIRKIIKQQSRIAKERIRKEVGTEKAKTTGPTIEPAQKTQEVHYHVNSENFYAGNVGVVASDDAIVNRPTMSADGKRRCPYCGAELNNDDKFCSKCGKQV